MKDVTLEQAGAVVAAAVKKAREINTKMDIAVVDAGTFISAPVAGLALQDLGASVTKVEAPDGDAPEILGQIASEAIVERFSGREAVCEPFRFQVSVLSSSAWGVCQASSAA